MIMSPGDQVLVTAVIIVMVALSAFFLAAAAEYAKAARAWALRVRRLVEQQVTDAGLPPWDDAPLPPAGTEPLDMRDVL